MAIRFVRNDHTGVYSSFSNYSLHSFTLDGKLWNSTEHFFQAQKFAGTEHERLIRFATSPKVAAGMGRSRNRPLRPDWEEVKVDVMRRAIMKKFSTHEDIRQVLLSTGDEEIIEQSEDDDFWGCGADGSGTNMLGRILMETRQRLRG